MYFSNGNRMVPVLMYHALEESEYTSGAADPGEQLYVLSANTFHVQMQYLAEYGFRVMPLAGLVNLSQWPEKTVVLTFDDGHASNYHLAYPILKQFAFQATFFITTGWVGRRFFLASKEIKYLAESGMEIGSHGVTHEFFSDMSKTKIREELSESHQFLCQCTGKQISSFSAPGGRISSHIVRIGAELGYSVFCTSRFAPFKANTSIQSVPRMAVKANTDLQTFQKMVHLDAAFLKSQQIKNSILYLLKKGLGNTLYERFRDRIFSWKCHGQE